jgi:hypothetical protein
MPQKTKRSRRTPPAPTDGIKVKGSVRLQVTEDGEIISDTGWVDNQITYAGWQGMLALNILSNAGSSRPSHIAIGTGAASITPSTTSLPGECGASTNRQAIGANTGSSTATSGASAIIYATFPSNSAITGTGSSIANVGIFTASSGTGLLAAATYATQSVQSNQAVNVSYTIACA